jgi:hypothetical protein
MRVLAYGFSQTPKMRFSGILNSLLSYLAYLRYSVADWRRPHLFYLAGKPPNFNIQEVLPLSHYNILFFVLSFSLL